MSVDAISFSAHADFPQTSEFLDLLKPPHVVLVHGEAGDPGHLCWHDSFNSLSVHHHGKAMTWSDVKGGLGRVVHVAFARACGSWVVQS